MQRFRDNFHITFNRDVFWIQVQTFDQRQNAYTGLNVAIFAIQSDFQLSRLSESANVCLTG